MEFSFIKVAVIYIQYIAYTVLIEMMQILARGTISQKRAVCKS